jgi:hypothetical protein
VKVDDGESNPSESHELSLDFQQLFATWFRFAVSLIGSWVYASSETRGLVAGPFKKFDFLWVLVWTGGFLGAGFWAVICSAIVALLFSTIVYLLSRGRVGFFWGFSITRDIGVVSGLIVGAVAGVLTVLASK